MKKKLLALGASFALCITMLATDMVVKLKNGEITRYDVVNVEEVIFDESISKDTTIVDESETPLIFRILSDSTVEVKKDNSYSDLNTVIVPSKVRINNIVYTVTSIEKEAFYGCSKLKSITIPDCMTNIGTYALYNCSSLEPKVLIYDNGTKCYGWIGDRSICTKVEIPDGVKEIGAGAFYRCGNLTSVTIPDGVTLIGTSAFSECTALRTIMFPESVTKINYAFYRCKDLDVIIDNYEENVIIGEDCLEECKSVTWLKSSKPTLLDPTSTPLKFKFYTDLTAEVIKDKSYYDLDSITIPSTVQTVDSTIYTVTSIENEAFYGCSKLKSIVIPECITNIGTYALYDCSGLTPKMLIYDNGTKCYGWIGDRSKCKVVEIPNGVKEIGAGAFYRCGNLTSVKIPNGVTTIGTSAFSECTALRTIMFPESVTKINFAFYRCDHLDVIIDNSKENVFVGNGCFEECKSVTWLKDLKITLLDSNTTPLKFRFLSNSTVELIKHDSYKAADFPDTILIPAKVKINEVVYTVTNIEEGAFMNCGIERIEVPSSVTNIGNGAFWNCGIIIIDNSRENITIGEYAFVNCTYLLFTKDPVVVVGNPDLSVVADTSELKKLIFEVSSDSTAEVKYGTADIDSLYVPSKIKIDGKIYTVTSIGDHAFDFIEGNLRGVRLPSTITKIGENAFTGAYMDTIEIPSSVIEIGEEAFSNCYLLKSVNIPSSVTSIRGKAFSGCKNLEVVIDNSKDNITVEAYAFDKCKSVTYTKE